MNYPHEFKIKALELFADFTLGAVHIEVVQSLLLSYVEFDIGPACVNFLSYDFSEYEFKDHELDDLFKEIGLLRLSEQNARDVKAHQVALDILKNQDSAASIANDAYYSYRMSKPGEPRWDLLDEIRFSCLDWEIIADISGESYLPARHKANQEAIWEAKQVLEKVNIKKFLI